MQRKYDINNNMYISSNVLLGKNIIGCKAGEYEFIFKFQDGTSVKLIAHGDCCSESWFEYPNDLQIPTPKIIKFEQDHSIDLPESNRQEYDQNTECIIGFEDGTIYRFYFRNSSNGYYSGWIEFE